MTTPNHPPPDERIAMPPGPGPARLVAEVPADLAALATLRAFVRQAGHAWSRPAAAAMRLDELVLAVHEAASNIILHAYSDRTGRTVRAEAVAHEGSLTIRLTHDGHPFDPDAVGPPSFDGTRDGGFGVFLIRHCVDNVTYARDEEYGHCHVLLTKTFGPTTSGALR